MKSYISRLIDPVLESRLQSAGAVVIDGPKASGKTETGRRIAKSEVLLDSDRALRDLAMADPQLVLGGAPPLLLDEWQVVPELWNAVRRAVDDRRAMGQFILTGSASPADSSTRHSGAGRFSRLRMRPLTLVETGHSSSEISLAALLRGERPSAAPHHVQIHDLAERTITGGWPASQHLASRDAARYAVDYIDQIVRLEIAGLEGVRHDPRRVRSLIRSLARTTASEASLATLATDAGGDERPLAHETVTSYLASLERIFVLEIQEAWDLPLRTRTALRKAPKRHLVDTSLTAASLRIGTLERLLGDPSTFGLLFESLVFQQLRVFADLLDAGVYHFRSKVGREVDFIIELPDGTWGAFEVKLGAGVIDAAATNLMSFVDSIDTSRHQPPAVLGVIVPTGPSYRRPDGVVVLALTNLGA